MAHYDECLVNGRWVSCEVLERMGIRYRVRVRGLVVKNAVVMDGKGITIVRRPCQLRESQK